MASEAEAGIHADALRLLNEARIPYVVAGAYALRHYTGIERYTKDLDLFMVRSLVPRSLALLARAGYHTEVLARHWLAHALKGGYMVDLIHGFGGWRAQVTEAWYERSVPGELHGVPIRIAPAEEMAWMKVYVAHRERFDGADVAHLVKAAAAHWDWQHFVGLFDGCWELLLSTLALVQFVYPSDRGLVPDWVMEMLLTRLEEERRVKPAGRRVTRGTLLDRFSYVPDVELWGYRDGRVPYAIAQGYRTEDIVADRREALRMAAEGLVTPSRVA